jgi:pSer/pThr/pTyr-binding forkhead associated (FHA) protein
MPDGTRVSLDGPLLLGRDPAGIPDRPGARLLALVDPGKTVSKTHALLEPTPNGVRVRELHSTNGVAIDTAAGRELLPTGGEAVAPVGATIRLGSFAIGVAAG